MLIVYIWGCRYVWSMFYALVMIVYISVSFFLTSLPGFDELNHTIDSWLVDELIDLRIDWLIDCWTDWLIDWVSEWVSAWYFTLSVGTTVECSRESLPVVTARPSTHGLDICRCPDCRPVFLTLIHCLHKMSPRNSQTDIWFIVTNVH